MMVHFKMFTGYTVEKSRNVLTKCFTTLSRVLGRSSNMLYSFSYPSMDMIRKNVRGLSDILK